MTWVWVWVLEKTELIARIVTTKGTQNIILRATSAALGVLRGLPTRNLVYAVAALEMALSRFLILVPSAWVGELRNFLVLCGADNAMEAAGSKLKKRQLNITPVTNA
jgi:uncharacterized membrane protein YkgB